MKKILLIIVILIFVYFLSILTDSSEEKENDSQVDSKTYKEETKDERTYNGVVYEKAFRKSSSSKDKHGSRSHYYYYLVDEDTKKTIICHNYSNNSNYSSTSTQSCNVTEGIYKIENDGTIDITIYDNGKEAYHEIVNKDDLDDISVQRAVSNIEGCLFSK